MISWHHSLTPYIRGRVTWLLAPVSTTFEQCVVTRLSCCYVFLGACGVDLGCDVSRVSTSYPRSVLQFPCLGYVGVYFRLCQKRTCMYCQYPMCVAILITVADFLCLHTSRLHLFTISFLFIHVCILLCVCSRFLLFLSLPNNPYVVPIISSRMCYGNVST